MEKVTLKPTSGRAVTFTGDLIGRASNSMDRACGGSRWSGETGRETELVLYRTARGKYVIYRHNVTCWQGERDSINVTVYDTADDLIDGFGTSYLALQLYDSAGIDTSFDLDRHILATGDDDGRN